jgi:hypothetical protein
MEGERVENVVLHSVKGAGHMGMQKCTCMPVLAHPVGTASELAAYAHHSHTDCSGASKVAGMLEEAACSLLGGLELRMPEPQYTAQCQDLRPNALTQAANDTALAAHMDECLVDWCCQVIPWQGGSVAAMPGLTMNRGAQLSACSAVP